MGKVIERLRELDCVASLVENTSGDYSIVLAEGYSVENENTLTAPTARAIHNFIKAAVAVKKTEKKTIAGTVDITVDPYPGLASENVRPRAERGPGWCVSEAEGRDAYERGYDIKSHYRGETASGQEFELGWKQAKKDALRKELLANAHIPAENKSQAA